jgi:DTW domain-containing protein YfiP
MDLMKQNNNCSSIKEKKPMAQSHGLFILILQHPQESKKKLATVPLIQKVIPNERLQVKIGLSFPSLKKILNSNDITPSKWGVLFLGTKSKNQPVLNSNEKSVFILNKKNQIDLETKISDLEGIVLLDGTWEQSKTLWWRNPWLLKLKRIALNPKQKSAYGNLRLEPRKECLSTIESLALVLSEINQDKDLSTKLIQEFHNFLDAMRS